MASSTPEERLQAALAHAERGFGVFPVWSTLDDGTCRCPKAASCTSAGKHPVTAKGFHDATTDPDRIRTFMSWDSQPNYGLVWPEGDDVVFSWDVDGADWAARLDDLKATYGLLPRTKTTKTPHGGLHLYYRWPAGCPLPDGNQLHGFIARWPMKGYVVGPKSRINGAVYESVAGEEIATLPPQWAAHEVKRGSSRASDTPLITVTGEASGYEVPATVETGHRHDAIRDFVASRWNRHLTYDEVALSVRELLAPRFIEAMDAARLEEEIRHAWDTCETGGWEKPDGALRNEPVIVKVAAPAAEGTDVSGAADEIVIDPLAIESRIERPEPLDVSAIPMPTGLGMLLDHLTPLTDAPFSSLTLASVIGLAGLMGNKPTLRWRGTQRMILYGALVGDSNYARKGQAINEVMATLSQIDPLLPQIKEPYIPSSGPAFIDTLAESKGQSVLMVTTEMGRVLANCARESETLSYDMRDAWDGIPVGGRTRKTGKINASDYHLSIIGATTPEDLVAKLTDTDIRNGWANRWLWFWAEKRPGGFSQTMVNSVDPATAAFIRDGIEFARALGGSHLIAPQYTMTLTPAAEAMLDRVSIALDVPAHGTVGVLRQRMPPIAVRIAMVAACLDQTSAIEVEHLEFGFALTDYAVQSIRAVFGTRIDDEVAMHILNCLRQVPDGWLNTGQIAKLIRKDGSRTNKSLRLLMDAGLIERQDRKTAGRPAIGYILRAS